MVNTKGLHEEHKRSVLKTFSWRIVSTLSTMLAVFVITRQLNLTAVIGLIDIFLRMPLYFFHERAWDKTSFGRTLHGNLGSVVRSPPVKALPTDTVSSVIQKMVASDIGAVVVVGRNGPLGLITEKDVLERTFQVGKDPSKTLARDIMSSPAASVDSSTSLIDMLKMMRDKDIRRLVVTQDKKPVGIVTERRILDALI
jgi:CBS domain-containing protein